MKAMASPNRRKLVALAGATLAAPGIVRAQAPQKVTFSLPWLANGSTAMVQVAKASGAFKRHGLDVEIFRGFGSLATSQAVAQGKFDFGMASAGPMILTSARGTPLTALATVNYDTTMGILVRKDSPVKAVKDLAGKKLGTVITSAENPFWQAFASASGLDPASITVVQMDNRILERALIDGQVDAITVIGSSSIPVLAAQGVQHRFFPFSAGGIALYSNMLLTRPETLAGRPGICEAVTRGLMEGLAFQLKNQEKAIDMLLAEVPELQAIANVKDSARLSQGLLLSTVVSKETLQNGLGWTDPAGWRRTVDLTMKHAVPAGTARPAVDEVTQNRFVGTQKLSAAEWELARKELAPFAALLA